MTYKHPDVFKADTDGLYYHKSDLEWASPPNDDDPGVTRPKLGATPCRRDGLPVDRSQPPCWHGDGDYGDEDSDT